MTLFRLFIIVLLASLTSCSSSKRELHIYSWGDYINPQVIREFEEKWHCQVVLDTYDSNESMYAKLKAGAAGYDIIFPSNYILDLLDQQDMLLPFDQKMIPNLKYLDQRYGKFIINPTTSHVSIPYMITFTGLGYRRDRIEKMDDSWNAFGQARWRGRMTMLNDFRETIGAGLKYLGFSVNSTKKEEIEAAADQVILWKKNLAKFESEQYKNGIATAEFLVVHGYSGDILQVMQEDDGVGFIFPKEGALISCDYCAIPKKALEPDLAHDFINFLYEPQVAAKNMESTLFICPNVAAYPYLPAELRDNQVFFPANEVLDKAQLIEDIGEDVILYYDAWDRIKAT